MVGKNSHLLKYRTGGLQKSVRYARVFLAGQKNTGCTTLDPLFLETTRSIPKPKNTTQQGYIALISVLIIGAAALAITLGVLLGGTDSQRQTLAVQQAIQARALAHACTEEALQIIHDTTSYTGSDSLTLGQGSCTYTVTSTGASTRTITTSATVNSIVKKTQVYVTITSSNISITSWQEVS